jgi:hypothetical protein
MVAPDTNLGMKKMEKMNPELFYEYFMKDAFNIKKKDPLFVNGWYYQHAQEHPVAFAAYFHCALILLAQRKNDNASLFSDYAQSMEDNLTRENALQILDEMNGTIPCINK